MVETTNDLIRWMSRRSYGASPVFFVDRDYRKKGVAKVALDAALDSIRAKGGGVVEAYPVTHKSARAWSKWSNWFWFGTESMFQRENFKVVGPMGPHHLLMRKTLKP